jgi:hypothetical protein
MSISWGGPYSPQRKWSLTFKVKFTTKRNELTMTKLPSQGGKILKNKNYNKKKKKKGAQQNALQRCLDLRLIFCFGSSSLRKFHLHHEANVYVLLIFN